MMRKENRNPNHSTKLNQALKATISHSNTPDCSSRANTYKPKFIKKSIKEELHSQTYINSPASFTQSTIGIEALVPNRPSYAQQIQRQLKDRTEKFNASILSFQHILRGIYQVTSDDSIPSRERLHHANERISDLLCVFQEFGLEP